jgi:hypothetical protein
MIKNLKEFDHEIGRISSEHAVWRQTLYRGQIDSSWEIKSSLERIGIKEISCEEYYTRIDRLKPLINPLIENKFIRKTTPFELDKHQGGLSWRIPEMEYLTYLRHHGFPTPIIDWTESHYIALFFACEDFVNSKTDGKVFIYNDRQNSWAFGRGELKRIGPYVETDKRHFPQQCSYVLPVIKEEKWKFITFKRVLEQGLEYAQEFGNELYDFVEIEIASEAKRAIMKELKRMNINRYTMYLDEDALIRHFADEWSMEIDKA